MNVPLIVSKAANLPDENDEPNYSDGQQPKPSIHSHQKAFHQHCAHCNPNQKCQ